MTKHMSEGLRNKLMKTKIAIRKRFKELEEKLHKTEKEWQEFHFIQDTGILK